MTRKERKEEFEGFVKVGLSVIGVIYTARAEQVIFQREPESELFYAHPKWGAALVGKFGGAHAALEQFSAAVEPFGGQMNLAPILAELFGYTEDEILDLA